MFRFFQAPSAVQVDNICSAALLLAHDMLFEPSEIAWTTCLRWQRFVPSPETCLLTHHMTHQAQHARTPKRGVCEQRQVQQHGQVPGGLEVIDRIAQSYCERGMQCWDPRSGTGHTICTAPHI